MTTQIIVTDPFAQTRRFHEVASGGTLAAALMEISPSRWDGSAFALYDGAIGPAGEIETQRATTIRLRDGEVYQVVVLPSADPITAALITAASVTAASAAGVAIAIAVHVAIMAITMAISYLATMLLTPGKQNSKSLASDDQPSALNSLAAPRNMFRLGSRIADIYGTMRFWPDLIFSGTTRWTPVAWDADIGSWSENTRATSQQDVRATYCVGRGHYQMGDFQFGDSPVATANGAVYVYPPGVPLPATITATYAVANLSRQELGGPNSVNMWSPWYEIPADLIHGIDIQLAFPGGLIMSVSGKKVPAGYVERMQADIRIQLERLDEDDNVVESEERQRVYESKTRNELRVTSQETVSPGRWRVRVAEVNDPVIWTNGNTYTVVKKTVLEGIVGHRTLTEAERTFHHETVLIVEANNVGGPALQNMENFNLLATRMLPTQDVPGVMTPDWRGDGRWITAAIHTLTDPFLCNYAMNEVDWPSLHAVQASLDAYPGGFTESEFNAALDRHMTADEQLMLIARKARAQVFPSAGRMTFARDERRAGVSALFNRRNRLVGRSDIGMGLQFAGRDDPDGVVISWTNAAEGYRQETYTYPADITPASPLTMDLPGATHSWEICRRARFEMAQIKYRRRTMPLRVTEEGQLLLPFDRVAVVMPWDEGVQDGEILEVDGLSLRLSRAAPTPLGAAARIRLRAPDGRQTALIPVALDSIRGPDWVALSYEPDFTILGEASDRQLGTLYSISTSEGIDAATHWLVTGAEIDDAGVAITLMEDADEIYQESDDAFDPCDLSPPTPTLPECSPLGGYGARWAGEPYAWTADELGDLVYAVCGGEPTILSRFCMQLRDRSVLFGNEWMVATDEGRGADIYIDWPSFADAVQGAFDARSPTLGYPSAAVADYPLFGTGIGWSGERSFSYVNCFGWCGGFSDSATQMNPGCGLAPLSFVEGLRTFSTPDSTPPVSVAYAYGVAGLFWSPNAVAEGFVLVRTRDAVETGIILGECPASLFCITNPTGTGFLCYVMAITDYAALAPYSLETERRFADYAPVVIPRDRGSVMVELVRT